MTLSALFTFAGGIALFLLGMRQMTDGLKVAAGDTLRAILVSATRSRVRGLFSGVLITTMVQSSSAVIFATVGFVNAGLLTLTQAIGVIYGANLGTTLTSWIVALVGFNVNLQALAMPALAVGMGLWVAFGSSRRGAIGQAIAGFGLFFLGLDILRETFAGPGDVTPFEAWAGQGVLSAVLFMFTGMALTVVMQSSSAALAVTLTAAGGGVITLETASAMVVGANVGTTSTALFASLGATAAAKRAAMAHVAFNVVTAVVALIILPLLVTAAQQVVHWIGLAPQPATVLAVFHTMTKLLGILLMWPLTNRMVQMLDKRFHRREEDPYKPMYLDRNVQSTPSLALDALGMELREMRAAALNATRDALNYETARPAILRETHQRLERLTVAIGEFAGGIHRHDHDPMLSTALPLALRVSQYYVNVAEQTLDYIAARERAEIEDGDTLEHLHRLISKAMSIMDETGKDPGEEALRQLPETLRHFEEEYQQVKARLLRAGTMRVIPASRMAAALEQLSAIHRMVDQAAKGARYLREFDAARTREPSEESDAEQEGRESP